MTRLRRALAAGAVVAAASMVLSGCIAAMIPTSGPTTDPRDPDTSGVSEELLPFYSQELSWTECGVGFDCTTVTAPLDWENPDDGDIEIAITRHRAQKGSQGSLLINPGGPGASGKSFVLNSMSYAVGSDLIANYDIIGFDPRGVGDSTAVQCFDADEMDAYLYDVPEAERGSPEWEAELGEANERFAEACDNNSDGILPFITTINSARDMDLLRGVLGDEELNYLGYSYGTFLGATYAELYPDRAGRLVLDGAVDPATSGLEVGTTQALGFESALRAYMEDCLTDRECPFSGTVDDAMNDLGALLASVDRVPLSVGDGRMLGADSLMTAIIAALYAEDNWPYLTDALTGALQGQAASAIFLADFYNSRSASGYDDNSTEAFRAYNCMDYPVEDDPAAEEAARKKITEGAPTIAPYWEGPDPCEVWPYPPTGSRGAIAASGAGPILVIGTTNDPATPYDWSVAMAEQLEEGRLITRVGEGHTGYNKGNRCVDKAVEAFFIDGTVPDDDLYCD
ncbi:alpha/beta hydrolase [Microbacterium sp. YY-01]|uniref:alpha/beta hydrolase n=1 Tax=Microbacterium sp. YY-01 TaxID=3421634 RepID=UPI003D18432B